MEAELEEERKQKGMATSAKKKLEGDLKDRESAVENANKAKEDSIRQQRRLQVNEWFCMMRMLARITTASNGGMLEC